MKIVVGKFVKTPHLKCIFYYLFMSLTALKVEKLKQIKIVPDVDSWFAPIHTLYINSERIFFIWNQLYQHPSFTIPEIGNFGNMRFLWRLIPLTWSHTSPFIALNVNIYRVSYSMIQGNFFLYVQQTHFNSISYQISRWIELFQHNFGQLCFDCWQLQSARMLYDKQKLLVFSILSGILAAPKTMKIRLLDTRVLRKFQIGRKSNISDSET